MTDSLPANQGLSFNTQNPSCGFSMIAHGAMLTTLLPRCLLYCIAHTLHVCLHMRVCDRKRLEVSRHGKCIHMYVCIVWTAASFMQRSTQRDQYILICKHPGDETFKYEQTREIIFSFLVIHHFQLERNIKRREVKMLS